MTLTALARAVADEVERRAGDLVALLGELIAYDTTARAGPDDEAREEAALQAHLAARLRAAGLAVELWEPTRDEVAGTPLVPSGLGFAGRPQLVARLPGAGGGRSLLLNGHVDVVDPGPPGAWSADPRRAVVRHGLLYGRGACDMKGGIAAIVVAAEVLAEQRALAGDLVVCTVTDEESTGAGGLAAVRHGVRADAGIVTEPSALDVWVACRGSLLPTVTVEGRAGHAGVPQRPWSEGGAVNAIDKAGIVMAALRALGEEWRARPDQRHPYLSPGDVVPTLIAGGDWIVTHPAACSVSYHVAYLPQHADALGFGSAVALELEARVAAAAAADDWLREHPPRVGFGSEVPAVEVDPDHPVVAALRGASADLGRPAALAGLDNWHDGATFTRLGGTPCVAFGPGSIERAHTADEHVPVGELVRCAQAVAVAALRFCGTRT